MIKVGVIPLPGSKSTQPEFVEIDAWINSPPLTLNELKGKVVLVEFWRYSCNTCIKSMPYLKSWHEKYASQGLVIVGVHNPKNSVQKDINNVRSEVKKHGLTYPIALDCEHETSKAFGSRNHPDTYLIDKNGVMRHHHIGGGKYEETEENIRRLLEE